MRSIKNKQVLPAQRQLLQQQQQIRSGICNYGSARNYNNKYNVRRKCRKKYKNMTRIASGGKTTSSMAAAAIASTSTNNNLLITTLLLLITMTATTSICQANPLAVTSTQLSAAASSPFKGIVQKSAASSAVSASLLSPTQQLQQQQQQLFALLTKNKQTSGHHLQQQQPPSRFQGGENVDYVDEDLYKINTSMETSGFIGDDGQQYEKAEQILAAASATAASSMSAVGSSIIGFGSVAIDCPKECKCLDDFFDCGKLNLDRVPALPDYVQNLDLVGNKLNESTALQIKNLQGLTKLSLKRNQLENIPKFIGLVALKQLNLANNRIQRISSEALIALPKLKSLDLSRNMLHAVDASYFPQTNRLAHLLLNSNEISSIDENALEFLSDLVELDLSNNHFSTLHAGIFKNLRKLKKLSLNNNNLEINWSTFKGLISLQKLFLKSNNIRTLQDGVFHVMKAIETIELDHNGITSLNRQGLFNLTKLHHLSLSNNSISRIELDTWEFTQSLISLDLSHNNISEFKPQHLECLQRLKHLNLGHNKINYLVENTFECVKNLEDLNLRRNKLAWIIEDHSSAPAFRALRKLKKLDLYGNHLKQINSKSLSGLISLETLNLGGNSLATIQSGAFDHMPHLQKVLFKSLNFICDCELRWFRNWLQRVHGVRAVQNSENALCGYPEYLLDREILSLTAEELICVDTPKPTITQEPSNQLAVKGANVTMECIAMSPAAAALAATDELKIKWRHDNQNVRERIPSTTGNGGDSAVLAASTETQIHHDQANNQTTIIGYLRLYNVSYDSAGKYQCVVTNAFGTTYSQKFKISIGIHPSFLQIPSNLTIDSGETARLVCSASGDPVPEIALQKFGSSDFPAATERRLQVIREENVFIITNAKPIDTGIYTCTAKSAAGEIKINASLLVNDKPQPSIPLVRKEIVLAQPSVLECLSDLITIDTPLAPHREWFKDNKPFHTSSTSASERYYFTAEKELLIIVNTQSMDTGLYRCEITDNSKTYTLQTELIVVKEDFNQNVIIIGVVLVTAACILIGSFIVWVVLYIQKRKLYLDGIRPTRSGGGAGGGNSGSVAHHLSQHTLSGSRAGALDQTQMTTLNRSYLQQQQYHQPASMLLSHQRPRSIANLELELNHDVDAEQRNCLIVSPDAITLEYLRGDHSRVDFEMLEHNQDHLSSKDSGTGSDAATGKRSIDDFTLTLMPSDEHQQPLIVPNPVQKLATNIAAAEMDNEENELVESPVLGVSEYSVGVSPTLSLNGTTNKVCVPLLHNNNTKTQTTSFSLSGSDKSICSSYAERERHLANDMSPNVTTDLATTSCKTNLSTNFTANAKHAQAVDI